MRAVIYCRISSDRTGEAAGVARQEAECRALAQRRDLTVTEVLVDNDISAFSGVRRPAYNRVLELVQDDEVDVVLAWHPDRLHRSLKELEEFISTIDNHNVGVFTATAGDVDLSTPIGRMIARQLGTFARYESEHRSERVKASMRQLAERGKWSGRRPYGYDLVRDADGVPVGDGRLVVVPHEAAVLREAAKRLLAGETMMGICRDLVTRGIPPPLGGKWRTPSLRSMLISPTLAGQREHLGTVVAAGLWEPILTLAEHAALRQRFHDNARSRTSLPARRYLLTAGLTVCGRCGYRLATLTRADTKRRTYSCLKTVDKDGCGGLSISAVPLEDYVTRELFTHLGEGTIGRLIANPRGFRRELQRRTSIEARMLDLASMWASHQITRSEWLAARASLAQQIATIPSSPGHLGGIRLGNPDDALAEWHALHVDQRRAMLQLVIDVIIVNPALRKGPKLHPERVDIRWR